MTKKLKRPNWLKGEECYVGLVCKDEPCIYFKFNNRSQVREFSYFIMDFYAAEYLKKGKVK